MLQRKNGIIFSNGILEQGAVLLTPQEIDAKALDNAKTAAIAELNRNREAFCLIPIEYNNKSYSTTLEAKNAISYLANSLVNDTDTAIYPTSADEYLTLAKTDFQAIAAAIQTREITSRQTRKTKKDNINACTTKAEVEAIDISLS